MIRKLKLFAATGVRAWLLLGSKTWKVGKNDRQSRDGWLDAAAYLRNDIVRRVLGKNRVASLQRASRHGIPLLTMLP